METTRVFKDSYRVSKKEEKNLKLVYSKPYLQIEDRPIFQATDTCCPFANELILYMENDRQLNDELVSLQERIAKGLTPSTAYYGRYVEDNLLNKLIENARQKYRKEFGITFGYGEVPEGRIGHDKTMYSEVWRYFGMVSPRKEQEIKKIEERIRYVSVPSKKPEIKLANIPIHYKGLGSNDCYQTWGVYVKDAWLYRWNDSSLYKDIRKECNVNVGKIGVFSVSMAYKSDEGSYLQLYVYDYANSTKAFRVALDYLIQKKEIKLDFSRSKKKQKV